MTSPFYEKRVIFRRDFIEIGNIDVFLEAVTIASACNKVLRKQFLKSETIGLIPAGGYSSNNKYSKKALMWLLHMEQVDDCQIMHARNGREYRLPELPHFGVDGYCAETRTVYEFLGCFYHWHTCQPYRDTPTVSEETLAERYERTMSRIEQITRSGYKVTVMWEFEFDEAGIVQQKPELLTHPVMYNTPLTTRDALYGGRTEAMCLHYKARDDETIEYCDIMSLYLYICKYGKFPTKPPLVHVGDTCKNVEACLKMEELMKCTIVPPKKLYHPVLHFRCNKKLLFCLCRKCVTEQNTRDECQHYTDSERALTETWVIDEVRLAVENGYKVLDIHEVFQYQVTQYDRATGEGAFSWTISIPS
jgi:G:T-mismatch repair DNA endonuclease (very short patch repair protein)